MEYDHGGDSFPFDFELNEFHFVQIQKENCHQDHIPFNVKGIGSIVFSVQHKYAAKTLHISIIFCNPSEMTHFYTNLVIMTAQAVLVKIFVETLKFTSTDFTRLNGLVLGEMFLSEK